MSDYGVKDIKTLEGIEAIRLRPGVFSPNRKVMNYSSEL